MFHTSALWQSSKHPRHRRRRQRRLDRAQKSWSPTSLPCARPCKVSVVYFMISVSPEYLEAAADVAVTAKASV